MTTSRTRRRRLPHLLFVGWLLLVWTGAFEAAAVPTTGATDPASQLEQSLQAIADGDRDLPRDTFDPAYVVQRLGTKPEDILAWVRDQTLWVPYRGLLRGDVGVLMDRVGNSLDRTYLLATLLE